jgi:hypothetical protein
MQGTPLSQAPRFQSQSILFNLNQSDGTLHKKLRTMAETSELSSNKHNIQRPQDTSQDFTDYSENIRSNKDTRHRKPAHKRLLQLSESTAQYTTRAGALSQN